MSSEKITLPKNTLWTSDILHLASALKIPDFVGVRMRDELSGKAKTSECGIVNLNTSSEPVSHWIFFYRSGDDRYFFDSFAEPPPIELLRYLKSDDEFTQDLPMIKRNSLTVQHDQSSECGSLCLYVLKQLSLGISFQDIIDFLDKRYHRRPTTPLIVMV